jgi:hypothetical protein
LSEIDDPNLEDIQPDLDDAGSEDPMVVHRDIARVWHKVGGYTRLLQMAEDDFEAFMRIVCRLSPKLQADVVQDSDISEEELDKALKTAIAETQERKPSVRHTRDTTRRAGRLADPPAENPDDLLIADKPGPVEYDEEGKTIQEAKEAASRPLPNRRRTRKAPKRAPSE